MKWTDIQKEKLSLRSLKDFFLRFEDTLLMDNFLTEAVKRLIGPTLDTFNHVNFQHLEAERLLISSINSSKRNAFIIPSDVGIHEFAGVGFRGSRGINELLNTKSLIPGNKHTINISGSNILIDDIRITSKSFNYNYVNNYVAITYSGSPISVTGDNSRTHVEEKLVNRFKQTFYDVKSQNTHIEGIHSLVNNNIINGHSDGTFKPWDNITRQHVALILYRTTGLTPPPNLNSILNVYRDVSSNSYYSEEIAAVTKAGIFGGSNGLFNPDSNITRQQMATVLVEGLNLQIYDTDENIHINLDNVYDSHRKNVQTLANLGITNQLDNFRPAEEISRAAFSTFLNEALKVVETNK